jgi:signal transduction histidine kinase
MLSETAKANEQNKEQLDKIINTSRRLVNDMSEIIWSMNPGQNTLDQMLAYLREQLRQLLEYSGIAYKIEFPENGAGILLSNAQKRNLLLAAKEIVHNAVKHSKATNLSVAAQQTKSLLRFVISDDGCGFDTNKPSPGNGLKNIRRRIEELGGSLQIESAPGKGSRFMYEIPLASS